MTSVVIFLRHFVLVGLLLLMRSGEVKMDRKAERPKYLTAYACEGSTLTIQCHQGHVISLIRANYGRFSISVCNENGVTDWSVNCMSNRSFRVLQERCNQQSTCNIRASSHIFGDSCPGTRKYLEAHYLCSPASTSTNPTTSKAPPSWLIWTTTTMSSDWIIPTQITTTQMPTQLPTTTTATTTTSLPTTTTTIATSTNTTTTTKTLEISSTTPATISNTMPNLISTTITKKDKHLDHCPPTRRRDIQWEWTKSQDVAIVQCPGSASGLAKWKCGGKNVGWITEHPDLSECESPWVSDLIDNIDRGSFSVPNIAGELARVTKRQDFYGGDLMATTAVLKKVSNKMADRLVTYPVNSKERVMKELMQSIVETGSNLLDERQRNSWDDLGPRQKLRAVSLLLMGLEDNALLLSEQLTDTKTLVISEKHIVMSIKVANVYDTSDIHYQSNDDVQRITSGSDVIDIVKIPVEALLDNSRTQMVKAVFFRFTNLEDIIQLLDVNSTQFLNSHVVSVSSAQKRSGALSKPITINFGHLHTNHNISFKPVCVFWDYNSNSWSPDGCNVVTTNKTRTVCSCNHMTNFAVLMDLHGIEISSGHEIALSTISLIGCVVSIVCLALALLTFTAFRGLRSDRITIHKNLCSCLLAAEVIFLAGIGQTDHRIFCGVIAGCLHFLFLCAFAWMFLEGFQLYVMLIEVFEAEKSRLRWYYVLAYGLPMLIVVVSCAIDPWSYGTSKYCWLRTDNYFVFSFAGPVIAVLVINFLFLFVAMYMMCQHTNNSAIHKNKEQSKFANIRSWIRGAVVLSCVLGLTWTFGLFYLNQETLLMAYLFTIFNSLQGFFIFIFHCVLNEKVQKEYLKLFRRTWCIADRSFGSKDRRSSFYINSNGTSSIPVTNSNNQQSNLKRFWDVQKDQSSFLESETSSKDSSIRDSGHGGSDREEISQSSIGNHVELSTGKIDYGGLATDLIEPDIISDYDAHRTFPKKSLSTFQRQHLPPAPPFQLRGTHKMVVHPVRPHVYMDVDRRNESEPVYEEIEQHHQSEIGIVSDASDEDSKRRSDISRQSSGSYGDSRPLIIPHQGLNNTGRQLQNTMADCVVADVGNREGSNNGGNSDTLLIATLEGRKVVCHLQPQTNKKDVQQCRIRSFSEC